MQTKNLDLRPKTRTEALADIETMPAEAKVHVSADWLARLHASAEEDSWVHGFAMVHRASGQPIGSCGFKGPPDGEGMVEIAYGVEPEEQGKGYATEAAAALTAFAWSHDEVRIVRAHTLPEKNASTRVLTKCGFAYVGEVIDPEDGPVWRWEKRR